MLRIPKIVSLLNLRYHLGMKKESSKEMIVKKGEKIYHAIKAELDLFLLHQTNLRTMPPNVLFCSGLSRWLNWHGAGGPSAATKG